MKVNRNKQRKAFFMVAPAIIVLAIIAVYPLLKSFWDSFFDMKTNSSGNGKFIGVDNYKHLFVSSSNGWDALKFTFIFTILSVIIEVILGILIASIINKNIKAVNAAKISLIAPLALPLAVTALIWKFLFDSQAGFFANLLEKIHIINNSSDIMSSHIGLTFAAIFADMWRSIPFIIILILISMCRIDKDLYEAARIEGTNKVENFFNITIPMIKPAIIAVMLFKILDSLRTFDLIYVLTGGARNTDTISTLAYKTMFSDMEMGKAAALSVVAFICSIIISIVFVKFINKDILLQEGWDNEK